MEPEHLEQFLPSGFLILIRVFEVIFLELVWIAFVLHVAAIHLVVGDREAQSLQMHSYLVGAPGLRVA